MEPGGAERMAVNIANALSESGVLSMLVSTRLEGSLKDKINNEVEYRYLNKKTNIDSKAFVVFFNFLRRNKVTHIHAHSSSFVWAVLAKLILPKLKIIWHNHNGNSIKINGARLFLLKFFSFFFDYTISVNKELEQWSKSNLFCKKNIVLPNFPVLEKKALSKIILKGFSGKKILCLANLRPEKNHNLLVEIAVMLKGEYPKWTFHLVGKDLDDEYSKKLKENIIKNNLQDTIYIYGQVNDVSSVINECEFGILTSIYEGLPVSILEFGLQKKTLISANVGDVSEIIQNNKNGILINSYRAIEYYEALKTFIENDNLYLGFGESLNRKVQSIYSKEKFVGLYLSFIN